MWEGVSGVRNRTFVPIGPLQLAIHVVQRRTKVALGQDNQRKLPFKIMYVFCLSCPSATFALQRGGFVLGEWLAAKGLLQPNFLKVRQVNITTLLITTLEDYRFQVLKDEIEQFNKLLTNMNCHGKEFHYSAFLMKYRH